MEGNGLNFRIGNECFLGLESDAVWTERDYGIFVTWGFSFFPCFDLLLLVLVQLWGRFVFQS